MYEGAVQDLIDELARLPGIGPRGAQRIAFHLLQTDRADSRRLAEAVTRVAEKVRSCERCFNLSEAELCRVCRDTRRDPAQVCVVEGPADVVAIERTQEFRGTYHVLGGAISPLEGVGPEQLHIRELVARLDAEPIEEVILATNSTLEGEATASYLSRLIGPLGVRVTRIASGLPVGGDLDYADQVTLGRAFSGRRDVA